MDISSASLRYSSSETGGEVPRESAPLQLELKTGIQRGSLVYWSLAGVKTGMSDAIQTQPRPLVSSLVGKLQFTIPPKW